MRVKLSSIFLIVFFLQVGNVNASNDINNRVDSLKNLISATTNVRSQGEYYLKIAQEHDNQKSFAEAVIQIDNAIICAKKVEDYDFLVQCLARKCYIYIDSSRDIKLRARKIAPVISDLVALLDKVSTPYTRSSIYTLQGIQVEIEHDYDDSEEMFNGLIDFQKLAIQELAQQPDTIKGLDVITEINFKRLELSSSLISWNRYDEALVYLNQLFQSKGSGLNPSSDILIKVLANQLLVELYHGQGEIEKLAPFIDSTLHYCTVLPKNSYDRHKANAYDFIHKVLFDIGNYEKAYIVQKQYFDLRELDFNESEILAVGKAESNLKMVQDSIRQAQIVFNKNLKIESKTKQNIWLTLGISISLIVLVVVFVLLRKINASKVVIERQNHQVNEALEEKELLLKEVHHRVKNNMQLVSSLLELQSEFAKDEFSKKILSEGNDRIKTLAFAHQKLYQNEDYENIELNDYFDQIIHHLLGQVDCKTTVNVSPNFVINIERGQVLGFVMNELIMNSLKYAWKDSSVKKQIWFSLKLNNDEIEFLYKDNGVGFPEGFSISNSTSLGYTLIPSFVKRQLKGKITCNNENGAITKIIFPREI